MTTKAEHACATLRAAADALAALPVSMRQATVFTIFAISPETLRTEAQRIEARVTDWAKATEDTEAGD